MATTLQKAFMRVIIETERNEQAANEKIAQHNAAIQKIVSDSKSPFVTQKKRKELSEQATKLVAKIISLQAAIEEAKQELPLANSHISTLSESEQQALRDEVLRDMAKASSPVYAAIEATFEMNSPGSSPSSSPSSSPEWNKNRQVSAPNLTEQSALLLNETKRISI